jgi:3-oxoacyl-[acyl-carrier protein] reductase
VEQTPLLAGKVAIVTGASRGIGRAIAEDMAANGAKVVVNYNSSEAAAQEVVTAIEANGGTAFAFRADVSDLPAAQALIKTTLDHFGQLDILVNNAGTTRDNLLMLMSEAEWDTVIHTNLKSLYNCCKVALKPMIRRKQGGRIINISSVVGLAGQGGQTNYAASKAGIIGFTKSLAKEVGPRQDYGECDCAWLLSDGTHGRSLRGAGPKSDRFHPAGAAGRIGRSGSPGYLPRF